MREKSSFLAWYPLSFELQNCRLMHRCYVRGKSINSHYSTPTKGGKRRLDKNWRKWSSTFPLSVPDHTTFARVCSDTKWRFLMFHILLKNRPSQRNVHGIDSKLLFLTLKVNNTWEDNYGVVFPVLTLLFSAATISINRLEMRS